jgi:hypothetical protein
MVVHREDRGITPNLQGLDSREIKSKKGRRGKQVGRGMSAIPSMCDKYETTSPSVVATISDFCMPE